MIKILATTIIALTLSGCYGTKKAEAPIFDNRSSVDFLVKSHGEIGVEGVYIGNASNMELDRDQIQVRVNNNNILIRDDGYIGGDWQTIGDPKAIINFNDEDAVRKLRLRDRREFINHNMNVDLVEKDANIVRYYSDKISEIKINIKIDDKIELLKEVGVVGANEFINNISANDLNNACSDSIVGMNNHITEFDKKKILQIIASKYNETDKYKQFHIASAQKEYSNAVAKYYAILKNEYIGVEYEVARSCIEKSTATLENGSIIKYSIIDNNKNKSLYLKDVNDLSWNAEIRFDNIDMDGEILDTESVLIDTELKMGITNKTVNLENLNKDVIKLTEIMFYFDGIARIVEVDAVLLPGDKYSFDMSKLEKGEVFRINSWDGKKDVMSGMKVNYEIANLTKMAKYNLDISPSRVWSEFFKK
jgi:hypothetical protein